MTAAKGYTLRRPPNPWVWLLVIALLALVAWGVGRTASDGRRPEPEIGVSGEVPPATTGEAAGERTGP